MASIKENLWNGGLIAGICGILCFALPAAVGSLEGVFYGVWMWGLYTGSMGGVPVTIYVLDEIGLIVSLIILGASIVLCDIFIKFREKKIDKKIGIIWTILGAVILSAIILYLVFRWRILILPGVYFHLALYLSLLSGSSALISGIFMIYIHESPKARELITKKERAKLGLDEENPDCPNCQLARTHSYDTCPSCGKQLK